MHAIHLSRLLFIALCANVCLCCNVYAADGAPAGSNSKRIVKWVDSQGVTHYGDKLPVQEAGRNNTEMNTQGVVLKQNSQVDKKTEENNAEKLAQQRKDSVLLASYTSADEIDLARDRSLQMDEATVQALISQKENIKARLARNQKTADGFVARKKPVPPYLADELKLAKNESVRVNKQIDERKLSMEATRKRFAEEKARYVTLKQTSAKLSSSQ